MMWTANCAISRGVTRSCGSLLPQALAKLERVIAKFRRPLVHHDGEVVLRARNALGQRDRRVIAGLDDQAANEVLDARLAVDGQEHRRTVRGRAAGAPGVFRHLKLVVELQTGPPCSS